MKKRKREGFRIDILSPTYINPYPFFSRLRNVLLEIKIKKDVRCFANKTLFAIVKTHKETFSHHTRALLILQGLRFHLVFDGALSTALRLIVIDDCLQSNRDIY